MEIVLIVAVAENGVIGAGGAIPWRLKSDMQRLKAMTMGKPVVMGRKTFESFAPAASGRTNIVVTRDAAFRAAGAVVTTSFADAKAIATGDALRRFATEIAVIGGAEIYAQWMDSADRLEITEVHARPDGDTRFAGHRPNRLGGGGARAESGRFARQRRLLLCDISSAQSTRLTSLTNVCIDNYGLKHSCLRPEACVVRDLAVPYKAGRICEA